MVKISLSEEELDAKLKEFGGLNNEMDENMRKTIGKLLIDEADEEINADRSTYEKTF